MACIEPMILIIDFVYFPFHGNNNRILNLYMKQYGGRDERVAMAMRALANVKCAKGKSL